METVRPRTPPKASSVRLNGGSALPILQDGADKTAKTVSPRGLKAVSQSGLKPPKIDTSISITANASSDSPAADSPNEPAADLPAAPPAAPASPQPAAPQPAVKAAELTEELAPAPETQSTSVCMPRDQAWIKLLAYEACLQVCIKAVTEGAHEAGGFLQDSCAALKTAFGCDGLTLRPPPPGEPTNVAGGAKLSWSESRQVYQPPPVEAATLLRAQVAGFSGLELGKLEKVFISMHALCQPEECGIWTSMAECSQSDTVDMTAAEQGSKLRVEVHNAGGLVAAGSIAISDLWQAIETKNAQQTAAAAAADKKAKQSMWRFSGKDAPLATAAAPRQPGPQSVEVFDKDKNSVGRVMLNTRIWDRPASAPAKAEPLGKPTAGPVEVTTWQVYEVVLDTALAAQGCGARNLALGGPWRWLLREVAAAYGVRPTFAALAFLRWAAGPERLTPTSDCLSMLAQELRPLKRAEPNLLPEEVTILGEVSAACEALLAQTFEGYHSLSEKEAGGILAGGASGPESPAPALAPAVRLFGIVKEEGQLRDRVWLQDRLRVAATRRYHRLHRNCVKRITENGYVMENKRIGRLAPIEEGGKAAPETLAYRRLEALCESVRAELENDRLIGETAVLPSGVDLPATTAPEYCQELIVKVTEVLKQAPPQKPNAAAVDLLLAVGRLQDFVTHSGSGPAPGARGALDAPALFAPHVQHWVEASQESLCKQCLALESLGPEDSPRKHSGPAVVPLVPKMQEALEKELVLYTRVVTYYPQFGPWLEAAICAALRDTIAATARQCGLSQQAPKPEPPPPPPPAPEVTASPRKLFGRKAKTPAPAPAPMKQPPAEPVTKSPSKRTPWQWRAPGGDSSSVVQAGVAPHEALLLNSLRHLLSAAPAMEAIVSGWCAAGRKERRRSGGDTPTSPMPTADEDGLGFDEDPDAEFSVPEIGQHFLQVVGELRSQYAVGVKLAAQRLADAVFATPSGSPAKILDKLWEAIGPVVDSKQPYWQRLSQPADPKLNSQQHVAPLLKVLGDTVAELAAAVDGRVLVALTRGLWELTAREIFDYLEGLQEGFDTKNAWRSRQNAALMLDHVDKFFRDSLKAGPRSGWQSGMALTDHDLERPFHSDKAHKLLATNTAASNMSFNPY